MKAQMFIVTTIFLVALVFAAQQMLLQGFSIDVPSSMQSDDYYTIQSIRNVLDNSITGPPSGLTCGQLIELTKFIEKQAPETGFNIIMERVARRSGSTLYDCSGNLGIKPENVNITFSLTGKGIERHVEIGV